MSQFSWSWKFQSRLDFLLVGPNSYTNYKYVSLDVHGLYNIISKTLFTFHLNLLICYPIAARSSKCGRDCQHFWNLHLTLLLTEWEWSVSSSKWFVSHYIIANMLVVIHIVISIITICTIFTRSPDGNGRSARVAGVDLCVVNLTITDGQRIDMSLFSMWPCLEKYFRQTRWKPF